MNKNFAMTVLQTVSHTRAEASPPPCWLGLLARTAAFPFAAPVLSASRRSPWTVAPIGQATLAGRLTVRWVRHRMVMVVFACRVRPLPPALDRFLRRLGRDQ